MNCHFVVGQKVVCVNAMTNDSKVKLPELVAGNIYIIRKVAVQSIPGIFPEELSVWVEGVAREIVLCGTVVCDDFGFRPDRFRPVVTRKTDISIFNNMVIERKQPERV